MSIQLKLRRGTTAQHSTFTGASGEVTVDTDKKTLVVHDGVTAGGNALVTKTGAETLANKTLTSPVINGFTGDTSVVNLGSGQFYKDASGNVGIGTSSPSEKLTVVSSTTSSKAVFTNSQQSLYFGAAPSEGQIYGTGAYPLTIYTNATERMRIDSSGNVGIGTSAPDAKLVISGYTGTGYNTAFNYGGQHNYIVQGTSGSTTFRKADGTDFARFDSTGQAFTKDGANNVKAAYDCRAWVNFNGTGTVAIRASGNVSSITDNGVGDYTVNFSTAMSDANYAACGGCGNENTDDRIISPTFFNSAPTTSSFRTRTTNNSGVAQDVSRITFQVCR